MTTNRDDNPQRRTSKPTKSGHPQAHERQQAAYKSGEERNPRNDRGQGNERKQQQGRGNDPDRG